MACSAVQRRIRSAEGLISVICPSRSVVMTPLAMEAKTLSIRFLPAVTRSKRRAFSMAIAA